MNISLPFTRISGALLGLIVFLGLGLTPARADWWDKQWPLRKPLELNATTAGVPLDNPTGPVPVLVRLHGGNFQFAAAATDGRDLRFTAADGKTLLPYQIESYDSLLNEAFVWVLAPDLKPGEKLALTAYYGKPDAAPSAAGLAYDADTLLVYHFSGPGAPQDSSGKSHHSTTTGRPVPGSLIGPGIRFAGNEPVIIPAAPTLRRAAGQPLTWSAWVKPAALTSAAVIFHWGDAAQYLQIGLDGAKPYAEVRSSGAATRTAPAAALADTAWVHLALVATADRVALFVNGVESTSLAAALPALETDARLGAAADGTRAFVGELDELNLSGVARSAGWLKFAAVSQSGSNDSLKLVALGSDESGASADAHGSSWVAETLGHIGLFGDIAKNMMFDGWIAVGVCVIMMIIGWIVALQKFAYLKKVEQGSEEFLRHWKQVSSDLTVLDSDEGLKKIGDGADPKLVRLMQQSPLYHIYHIGAEEIRHRIDSKRGFHGLSNRSITAIKASLDAGLTREVHRLNSGLVSLTIGIAGGPYVGLMGTVVGVMITFAVIAKTGQVEVNSIAPGIASALLATVFGLLVAIPALFLYSFLNSRIKDAVSNMQLFIDEFITKMAEFYPTKGEGAAKKD